MHGSAVRITIADGQAAALRLRELSYIEQGTAVGLLPLPQVALWPVKRSDIIMSVTNRAICALLIRSYANSY